MTWRPFKNASLKSSLNSWAWTRKRLAGHLLRKTTWARSLDTVELVMELEEEFDITIPDDAAEKIETVGQAIEYIEQMKLSLGRRRVQNEAASRRNRSGRGFRAQQWCRGSW